MLWGLGAAMAVSNLAGSQVGARLAVRRGSAWVRRVFVVVVGALVLRLAHDLLLSAVGRASGTTISSAPVVTS